MVSFEDMLKSIQLSQNILKSSDFGSQISEALKFQEGIFKNLSGVNMMAEIAKSMQFQKMFVSPNLSAFETMSKSISHQLEISIPQTTIDAIASINRQHEKLFSGIGAMTEALKIQSPAFTQINNLNFALSSISGQIATIAAQQRNWTIIDDYEEVTEQAIEFSESLTEEFTEEQKRQFQVLLTLVSVFVNKHKQKGVFSIRFLEVVFLCYGFYSIFSPKPELAEKEDIRQIYIKQDTLIHYINLLNEQLREAKEYRITKGVCEVKLKPKTKTLTVSRLPKDFELIVLQVNHKWVLVSFFDPKDNLPQTGWVMKKCLSRPAL